MSQQDRIRSLEYEKARLARQISGVDARKGEFDAPSLRHVQEYATSTNEQDVGSASGTGPITLNNTGHGFSTGDEVAIEGADAELNGTWTITVVTADSFSLNGSAGDGSYTSGGTAQYAQPVQVKRLRWDRTTKALVAYGAAFRVGDIETASQISAGQKFWVAWRGDIERWYPIGGGISDHFQLIRGTTTGAVDALDLAFQIQAISEFEEHATAPTAPVGVAAPPGGVTLSSGDYVWAAYHKAFTTHDFGAGVVDVDWVMIPTSEAASTPALRRFELTVAKVRSDPSATVKWLDFDNNLVGDPVTVYDPGLKFYGKPDSYLSGEVGFRGFAILRSDLAEVSPGAPRYEIIAMEGYARWVIVDWVDSPTNQWQLDSFGGDQWQFKRPVADASPLTVTDPAGITADKTGGETAIAELTNPDTSPPEYQIRTMLPPDPEQYRAIQGLGVGNVTPVDTTFSIDNVVPLANGLDPVGGNPASTVTVHNTQKESFADNTQITAIHDGTKWIVLVVERYRMIRGEAYTSVLTTDARFEIKNIEVLGSGLDPRVDTTDALERIWVANIHEDSYAADDKVIAVYNNDVVASPSETDWEALPKAEDGTDGASGIFVCTLSGTVSAGSTANMGVGSGTVYSIGTGSALTSEGTRTIHNPFAISLPATGGGATLQYTCAKTYEHDPETETSADDKFTITGIDPLHLLTSLAGFAATKVLYSDGTAATNIKWAGAECVPP